MRLNVLGSSSKGNGYILQNGDEALIIECGIKIREVLKSLGFNTKKISGCLVTHEHGDHAKYVEDYLEHMDVYMSEGTANSLPYKKDRRPRILSPLMPIIVGSFKILPFPTEHDSSEPFGFLIEHPDIGVMLFATDTYYMQYKFDNLDHILIECNYDEQLLMRNVAEGLVHPAVRKRTIGSHMSIDTTIRTLLANDMKNVRNIVLLHLSTQNSDSGMFVDRVSTQTGRRVVVAKQGLELELTKTPF